MSPTARSAAPLARPPRRRSLLACGSAPTSRKTRSNSSHSRRSSTCKSDHSFGLLKQGRARGISGGCYATLQQAVHRITSTGPRTHPRRWPTPRPPTAASKAARRLPLLSRGATGLRAEIHRELSTSRRAPPASETDHSCSQRRRAGCGRACGRRGAAALGASRTGRGVARSGLASIPCTCGSCSASRRLPPAWGLHVRGHIGGGQPHGWGVLCSHADLTGRARPFVERVSSSYIYKYKYYYYKYI